MGIIKLVSICTSCDGKGFLPRLKVFKLECARCEGSGRTSSDLQQVMKGKELL